MNTECRHFPMGCDRSGKCKCGCGCVDPQLGVMDSMERLYSHGAEWKRRAELAESRLLALEQRNARLEGALRDCLKDLEGWVKCELEGTRDFAEAMRELSKYRGALAKQEKGD